MDAAAAGLDTLLSRELDPLFWPPQRLGMASAWWAHVPFAFWIMVACRPRVLVELGTHNGISYAAFCEAVLHARLGTRCYAVDTWVGDEHSGLYGEEVYRDLRDFHDTHYAAFSNLLRSTFDDAVHYFENGSIDLLHIDGHHTYEAVKHDFETWRPKLSDRAIVLFHDTNVRERNFGVYQFFAEISKQFPSFEFSHGYGLGVVAFGDAASTAVKRLCAVTRDQDVAALSERFSHFGERWFATARETLGMTSAGKQLAEMGTQVETLNEALSHTRWGIGRARNDNRDAQRSAVPDAAGSVDAQRSAIPGTSGSGGTRRRDREERQRVGCSAGGLGPAGAGAAGITRHRSGLTSGSRGAEGSLRPDSRRGDLAQRGAGKHAADWSRDLQIYFQSGFLKARDTTTESSASDMATLRFQQKNSDNAGRSRAQ